MAKFLARVYRGGFSPRRRGQACASIGPMSRPKKPRTRVVLDANVFTTYYVRNFPRDLVREINAAATLRNLPIGTMLAELVRVGLAHRRGPARKRKSA